MALYGGLEFPPRGVGPNLQRKFHEMKYRLYQYQFLKHFEALPGHSRDPDKQIREKRDLICPVKTIHLNPSNLNGLVWGVTTVAVDGSGGWGSILCCLSETLCWLWLVLAVNFFSDARTDDAGRDDEGTDWLDNGLTGC